MPEGARGNTHGHRYVLEITEALAVTDARTRGPHTYLLTPRCSRGTHYAAELRNPRGQGPGGLVCCSHAPRGPPRPVELHLPQAFRGSWSGLRRDAVGHAAAWGPHVSSGQSQHGGLLEADTWLLPGTVTWLVGGRARMLTTLLGGGCGPALNPGGLPRRGPMAQRKWPRPLLTPEYREEGSKTKHTWHTGGSRGQTP